MSNLLRIPHDERQSLRGWSLAILGALEPKLGPQQLAAGNEAVVEFCDYLKVLIARRRRNPSDDESDVLSRLIRGEGGEALSEMELLHNCIFILNAGHETTTNLIGNGLYALMEWPQERRLLVCAEWGEARPIAEALQVRWMDGSKELPRRAGWRLLAGRIARWCAQILVEFGLG